jgi:hypothetical protein
MTLTPSTVALVRLTRQLADRFERLGVDEQGVMDPEDKKLLDAVREQTKTVLAEPMHERIQDNLTTLKPSALPSRISTVFDVSDTKPDPKGILRCPDCSYSTRSELQFTGHLISVHAAQPAQAVSILEKVQRSAKL